MGRSTQWKPASLDSGGRKESKLSRCFVLKKESTYSGSQLLMYFELPIVVGTHAPHTCNQLGNNLFGRSPRHSSSTTSASVRRSSLLPTRWWYFFAWTSFQAHLDRKSRLLAILMYFWRHPPRASMRPTQSGFFILFRHHPIPTVLTFSTKVMDLIKLGLWQAKWSSNRRQMSWSFIH